MNDERPVVVVATSTDKYSHEGAVLSCEESG
jgi:hypothetical protein